MSQCSDAVWRMAVEVMEGNRLRDDHVDAATEKLAMFTHTTQNDASQYPDGEALPPAAAAATASGS